MARKPKKYSLEFKIQAIKDYKAGKGSLRNICKKYGIKDHKHYESGFDAIMAKRIQKALRRQRRDLYDQRQKNNTGRTCSDCSLLH